MKWGSICGGPRPACQAAGLLAALAGAGWLGWLLRPGVPSTREAGGAPVALAARAAAPALALTPDSAPRRKQALDCRPETVGAATATATTASHELRAMSQEPHGTRGPSAVVRWSGPFARALVLLDAQRPDEALTWLKAQEPVPPGEQRDAAAVLRGRALLALGKHDEARAVFAASSFAQAKEPARADARLGAALCATQGRLEDVPIAVLAGCVTAGEPGWGLALACREYARRWEAGAINGEEAKVLPHVKPEGKVEPDEAARCFYQEALLTGQLPAEIEQETAQRLDDLTSRIIFDPRRALSLGTPKAVFHTVAPGDSLYRIARQYRVPIGHLCRLNRLDPKGVLPAGNTLKVLPGSVTVRVDRWRLTATLLLDGIFLRRYPVGIGADGKTPSGRFTIRRKQVNPDWYFEGRRIPFGDPRNTLGTRWLGFDPEEDGGRGAGLGLHGTTVPESVPGRESRGCVRLLNADVEELYDFVPEGAVVEIGD